MPASIVTVATGEHSSRPTAGVSGSAVGLFSPNLISRNINQLAKEADMNMQGLSETLYSD